jgi:hypothetical protein
MAELQTFRNSTGTDFTVAEASNALSLTDTSTYMVVVSGSFAHAGFATFTSDFKLPLRDPREISGAHSRQGTPRHTRAGAARFATCGTGAILG